MKYWADNGDEGGRAVEIKFSASAAAGHTLAVSLRVTSAEACLIMYGGASVANAARPMLSHGHRRHPLPTTYGGV